MNKHQKLALLIAPFLIIGGYVAADYYVLAKEEKILQEQLHQLLLEGQCNLQSSPCTLKTTGVKIQLTADYQAAQLSVESTQPLDGITLGAINHQAKSMTPNKDNQHWVIALDKQISEAEKIRLVTSINKIFYYAEINLTNGN